MYLHKAVKKIKISDRDINGHGRISQFGLTRIAHHGSVASSTIWDCTQIKIPNPIQ